MNLCASLQYPIIKSGGNPRYREIYEAIVPQECCFLDAVDYQNICCTDQVASDGHYLGERVMEGATGFGTVISERTFYKPEHYVKYSVSAYADSVGIRYHCKEDTKLQLVIDGTKYFLKLEASDEFCYRTVEFPTVKVCSLELRPTGQAITLDSICIGKGAEKTVFRICKRAFEPERKVSNNRLELQYQDIEHVYTVEWAEPAQKVRQYHGMDIGQMLQQRIHEHVATVLRGMGEGVYENILSEPVFLKPGETKKLHFTVSCDGGSGRNEHVPICQVACNPDGEPFAFSQNMMLYNTFLNIVYPIYTRRGYIRHNTPGRNWDSLYSWDSGFIGMGLGTADFQRAFDCLNTYLTPVGDKHSPYIFHGSMIPTQIFLYQYLLEKYPQKKECLKQLYPMVKQYYRFYADLENDPTQMKSGLLKTWHIFYNSGGWDDYPPQDFLRLASKNPEEEAAWKNTTPVITTAVLVLIAKIMKLISAEFGFDDAEEYENTIEKYTNVLQSGLWDDECGYFSYMVHDEDGMPKKFLRTEDGSNFNMGFDGIYPYISGSTDKHQQQKILLNIREGLMTDVGVSVVDKRAEYYSTSGYWNGSVWMPHQWILWKSLLDYGETEFATEIAEKALGVWKREVDETYCCFEHFMTVNGRGCGFHQFSGLSTPVLLFFESYYRPGTITLGFRSLLKEQKWNDDKTAVSFVCDVTTENSIGIVCLDASGDYCFTVNGEMIQAKQITAGAYAVSLKKGIYTVEALSY